MSRLLKIALPIALIAVGSLVAMALIRSREQPEARPPEVVVPLVRVDEVRLQDLQLTVHSQGTVSPRTESFLVPEVSGRVIEVSPSFVSGGFFEEGQVLLRVDAEDYRQAVIQARAQVTQAELRLASEMAEAEVAQEEWEDLGRGGSPSPLTSRQLHVSDARAALASAQAALERAERDLARTAIRAPFAGRVRDKQVDFGQFVTRGSPVATIYSIDFAEIRLPLPNDDLAFVKLPLVYRGDAEQERGAEVVLSARFAGKVHEWRGRIVRTEGEIDPRTRMVHAVARVKDPYARSGDPGDPNRPPLAAGLFVDAEILGEWMHGVAVVSRSTLRGDDRVLVVDDENRLRFRTVEVVRRDGDDVVIGSGLSDGDLLCLSTLSAATEGMRVRPSRQDADEEGA